MSHHKSRNRARSSSESDKESEFALEKNGVENIGDDPLGISNISIINDPVVGPVVFTPARGTKRHHDGVEKETVS